MMTVLSSPSTLIGTTVKDAPTVSILDRLLIVKEKIAILRLKFAMRAPTLLTNRTASKSANYAK